jgi:hypothetical protein
MQTGSPGKTPGLIFTYTQDARELCELFFYFRRAKQIYGTVVLRVSARRPWQMLGKGPRSRGLERGPTFQLLSSLEAGASISSVALYSTVPLRAEAQDSSAPRDHDHMRLPGGIK